MSKLDKIRTAKYSTDAQEWAMDINPHKSTKKAKEHQAGKKAIKRATGQTEET